MLGILSQKRLSYLDDKPHPFPFSAQPVLAFPGMQVHNLPMAWRLLAARFLLFVRCRDERCQKPFCRCREDRENRSQWRCGIGSQSSNASGSDVARVKPIGSPLPVKASWRGAWLSPCTNPESEYLAAKRSLPPLRMEARGDKLHRNNEGWDRPPRAAVSAKGRSRSGCSFLPDQARQHETTQFAPEDGFCRPLRHQLVREPHAPRPGP